jgi:hypothetical protein
MVDWGSFGASNPGRDPTVESRILAQLRAVPADTPALWWFVGGGHQEGGAKSVEPTSPA